MESIIGVWIRDIELSEDRTQILFKTYAGDFCFSVYGDEGNTVTISSASMIEHLQDGIVLDVQLCKTIYQFKQDKRDKEIEECFIQVITDNGISLIELESENDYGGNVELTNDYDIFSFSPLSNK